MMLASLSPWLGWLLIVVAVAAAIATFVIRPRPPHRTVASLVVWQRVVDDVGSRSVWERLRWLVSLALTALIAALVATALARPALRAAASTSGRTLIVIDSSWSMRARTPSGATRWALAIQGARATANGASGGEVALATTGEGVIEGPTSDMVLIHSALDRLVPSGGEDRGWPRIAGEGAVHFFTDGALSRAAEPGVAVHSVFAPAGNVAVTAFDVQPAGVPGAEAEAFVAVSNFASQPQKVHLTITREAAVIFDRSFDLPAGGSHREVVPVTEAGGGRFHARVSAPDNALDIDDDASVWLATSQPLHVGVVGSASGLTAMLMKDASLRVAPVDPANYPKATADVWVFDRWLPAAAPGRPALIVDPPAASWLGQRGADEAQPIWRRPDAVHQVLEGVDTSAVRVGRATGITAPQLQPIATTEGSTPLVSIEDTGSARYVVLGFPVADPGFASTAAFPVLVGNALDWLGRPERDVRRQPGIVVLPATTRRVIAPDGRSLPLAKLGDAATTTLTAPGLYLVESPGAQSVLTVGLDDPRRSNLMTSSMPRGDANAAAGQPLRRPWWMYLTGAALGLLLLESLTWRRRVTV
ncbi:MAG: VWA domain-containing protein [Acidobacteriota bacterium]